MKKPRTSSSASAAARKAPLRFLLTAGETFTLVAFGEARKLSEHYEFPKSEWSRQWKRWPEYWLDKAFEEIETGTPWQPHPDDCPRPDVNNVRAHARLMMEATGESASDLLRAWKADTERHERNREAFIRAGRTIMEKARYGPLAVLARPAFGRHRPNLSAVHQVLDPALLLTRVINVSGELVLDEMANRDAAPAYEGPWFDDARFDERQVRAIGPASSEESSAAADDIVYQCMLQLATEYHRQYAKPAKKDDVVADCVEACKCRVQDARIAHTRLPEHLRRLRGNKRH